MWSIFSAVEWMKDVVAGYSNFPDPMFSRGLLLILDFKIYAVFCRIVTQLIKMVHMPTSLGYVYYTYF